MIRVVVTGSECTGKTTLAQALAEHYGTFCVPEYARQFVLEKGAPPVYRDVEAIARGQIALEDSLVSQAAEASPLLIQDTDLLSTVVYSRHYYGDCPGWVEEAQRNRGAELYLLADIDVPWAPDGDQRDRGGQREAMQTLFRQALIERGLHFVEIQGSRADRSRLAVEAIDELRRGP
ncbi:MAG: ATP-binding protein [Acidobacteria bacterium]|nr:ATP-binding protein [Acidobacteriota bacterium]